MLIHRDAAPLNIKQSGQPVSTIVVHGVLSAAALGVMYENTWFNKHYMLNIDITATFIV